MIEVVDINLAKKKSKTRYIVHLVLISLLTISIIAGALLLLLLSNLDYVINLVFDIIICASGLSFVIFYFINVFPVVRHYYVFYRGLNDVSMEHRRRMIFETEIEPKTMQNVEHRTLQFSYREGEKLYIDNLYVLDSDVIFENNKAYKIDTYHNVIIRYEVVQDATLQ